LTILNFLPPRPPLASRCCHILHTGASTVYKFFVWLAANYQYIHRSSFHSLLLSHHCIFLSPCGDVT
jgi:hypothetical protein